MAGKKFLLVLDDVWNDDYFKWAPLENILNLGGAGSKVLVTSRIEKVFDVMGTQDPYRLGDLNEHECMSLFNNIAFEGAGGDFTREKRSRLEETGRDMVHKCRYLPLAVEVMRVC